MNDPLLLIVAFVGGVAVGFYGLLLFMEWESVRMLRNARNELKDRIEGKEQP